MPEGKGSIRGRVLDASSGAPIADATVTLAGQYTAVSRSVQANAGGEFLIDSVPTGVFALSARKDQSYSGGRYGQRTPDSTEQPFELADGEQASGVELRLWRNAVVSGKVTDDNGRGIPGVSVQSLRLDIANGVRHLRAGIQARTDATGRYRIERIWPGTYGVAVVSTQTDGYLQGGGASAAFAGYPTTFYPAAASIEGASLMELSAGEERGDIDFTVITGSLVSVAGTIEGVPPGARVPVIELHAGGTQALRTNLVMAKTTANADGRFRFPRVRPGAYVLRTVVFPLPERTAGGRTITQSVSQGGFGMAYGTSDTQMPLAPLPAAPTLWADLPVLIPNGDVAGLTVTLRPGGRIQGRVEFKGPSPLPTAEQLLRTPVMIMGVEGRDLANLPVGRIEADGRFSTAGLPPGRYGIVPMTGMFMHVSGGWDATWKPVGTRIGDQVVGSIEVQDADVTGVTITFSDSYRATEVTGLVRDASGRTRPDATIYIFPADVRDWMTSAREVRPGRSGTFVISNLPPREYSIAAVIDEATELWREKAFLEKLSAFALRVTLVAGQTQTIDLTVR